MNRDCTTCVPDIGSHVNRGTNLYLRNSALHVTPRTTVELPVAYGQPLGPVTCKPIYTTELVIQLAFCLQMFAQLRCDIINVKMAKTTSTVKSRFISTV
jgi:hypothetical protein